MTQEEAIKILKDFHDESALFSVRTALETLYPELKESEDERIIKILQEGVNDVLQDQFCTNRGVSKEKVLSWLEKQGESSDQIHYWTEEEIEPIISDYLRGTEHYGGMIGRLRCLKPKSLEKQGEQKPANTVEQKCEESKTKIFDAPTPFEDKLYAFVAACEFLTLPAKIEFIKEHSQELLDAAKEQIEKEETEWTKEDEHTLQGVIDEIQANKNQAPDYDLATYDRFLSWLKSLKDRYTWKPSDEQMEAFEHFVRSMGESGYASPYDNNTKLLYSLLSDLKKLKEE